MHEKIKCVSSETISGNRLEHGDLVYATAVTGTNILRDFRETVTNITGGTMIRYEHVLDKTIDRALFNLRQLVVKHGYDGVVSLRIVHPHITEGAVEVTVYGTGVWFREKT
ncbi:MAG: hypothetical protein TECD_00063 [Hyphomicrobiaceae bacterium hypho_1]